MLTTMPRAQRFEEELARALTERELAVHEGHRAELAAKDATISHLQAQKVSSMRKCRPDDQD